LWSVDNNFTDKLPDEQSTPKKLYPLHFVGTSIAEYNISLIEKPYVMPSVIFFHQ
jgi:hypothetical protein